MGGSKKGFFFRSRVGLFSLILVKIGEKSEKMQSEKTQKKNGVRAMGGHLRRFAGLFEVIQRSVGGVRCQGGWGVPSGTP